MRAKEVLADMLKKSFKPKELLPCDAWVEKHVRLSAKSSAITGAYRLSHTPYLRQIYKDVSNPRVRKIVLKKSAQVGATQLASNVLLYYICNFNVPLLMVMPSQTMAQQFTSRCFRPSLDSCKAVQPFLTGDPDDLRKVDYQFQSCIARVVGAGSAAQLASNQACLLILDEADELKQQPGDAHSIELAEARTLTFPHDKKVLILSTPKDLNTSAIHREYLRGSQSKYFVPCHCCGHSQVLTLLNVKWPEDASDEAGNRDFTRIEQETRYECESCNARWNEQQKREAIGKGEWRDTNEKPFPAEIRSYHISALYSFNITLGALVKEFLLVKDSPEGLKAFRKNYLGECWETRAETIKAADIREAITRSPKYLKGQLLERPELIIAAADVQGTTLYYSVEAIYKNGSSAVIDYGQAATFADLAIVADRRYDIPGTTETQPIYKFLIDSGYKTDQVYSLARLYPQKFLCVKGVNSASHMFSPVRESSIDVKGRNIKLMLVKDDYFKEQLLITTVKGNAIPWYLPQDASEDFVAQLSSTQLVEKKVGNRVINVWVTDRMDHWLDTSKYCAAFKFVLAPVLEKRRKAAESQATEDSEIRQAELRPVAVPVSSPYGNGW